jgi:hypothetical protein
MYLINSKKYPRPVISLAKVAMTKEQQKMKVMYEKMLTTISL